MEKGRDLCNTTKKKKKSIVMESALDMFAQESWNLLRI